MTGRSTWLRRIGLPFLPILFLSGFPLLRSEAQTASSSTDVYGDYVRLRATNAVLKAKLSLSKEADPYLILDIPEREVRLELQGVSLTRVPVRKVVLNKLAEEMSRDTTRIAFCEVPFELRRENWYEPIPLLAVKDSAAVMSHPDTTGALVALRSKTPILTVLQFERNLAVAMNGFIPPPSRWERIKATIREWYRSWKAGTPEHALRSVRSESILVQLEMEPLEVRSFAPNVRVGTKLVLKF